MSASHKRLRREWWAARTPEERTAHFKKAVAGRMAAAAERERLKRAWFAEIDRRVRESARKMQDARDAS